MTLRNNLLLLAMAGLPLLSSQAAEPTFNCAKVPAGSIEALICQTPSLGVVCRRRWHRSTAGWRGCTHRASRAWH